MHVPRTKERRLFWGGYFKWFLHKLSQLSIYFLVNLIFWWKYLINDLYTIAWYNLILKGPLQWILELFKVQSAIVPNLSKISQVTVIFKFCSEVWVDHWASQAQFRKWKSSGGLWLTHGHYWHKAPHLTDQQNKGKRKQTYPTHSVSLLTFESEECKIR